MRYTKKRLTSILSATVASCAVVVGSTLSADEKVERPNVILIVGDDIGFSDIGCYGSEIKTPNLDRLGTNGVRFTQFYNMAKCNPTRASLLTGLYLPRKNAKNVQAFPQLLRNNGYYTAISGKEHFDRWVPKSCRAKHTFDDSFCFWACINFFIPPSGEFKYPFELNGKVMPAKDIPIKKKPFFKTDVVTDYALKFIDKAQSEKKPFFLYLPYHTAHYPLQARKEDIAKYRGTYRLGWDKIRQARFEKQKKLGILPQTATLSPAEGNINKSRGPYRGNHYKYRPWESVPEKEQDELDLEMAVFAGMIDCMDQNIGRVLNKLEELKCLDNTLIMFFSDNGSCPYDSNKDLDIPPGGADSYRCLCAAWANVGNTPFRYYKQYGHEGGSRTHFIAHWPKVIKPGLNKAPAHLVDIYPTLLEMAGGKYPETVNSSPTPSLDGHSLLPLFKGNTRPEPELIISGFTERFRMVRAGDWKIVKVNNGPWELYNIAKDPTELNNLATEMPEKLASIEARYKKWRSKETTKKKDKKR